MTHEQFNFWLQGFLWDKESLTVEQVDEIKRLSKTAGTVTLTNSWNSIVPNKLAPNTWGETLNCQDFKLGV